MLRFVVITTALLLIVGVFWVFEDDLPAAEVDRRYSNAASQFLTMPSGARLHYRDQGRADGPALLLLHGANASLHAWEPWVAELGDRYRVITLDLPGHGLTGRVPDDDYGPAAQAAAVAAVAAEAGLERFVIGGNSMGGGVAWRYALDHPQRIKGLILLAPVPPAAWREALAVQPRGRAPVAFALLSQPWFRAVARYLDPQLLLVQGLRSAYHDPALVDDALIARYRDLTLREGTRAAILSRSGRPRDEAAASAEPGGIRQPTLLLWGAHDALIAPEFGERFRDAMPAARLIVYPDLGHVPMEEAPARTATDARAFLDALNVRP
ncbi:MAG: alpha/beta hydrolase [Pseudomonadales bacterium]